MQLYFTCPELGKLFGSENYSLDDNHAVKEHEHGRALEGTVTVQACPLCGSCHRFPVGEVLCSIGTTEHEK